MIKSKESYDSPKRLTLSLTLGIVTGLLLIVVIVLGVLYGIERNKSLSIVESDEYCLNPSCIKAGQCVCLIKRMNGCIYHSSELSIGEHR